MCNIGLADFISFSVLLRIYCVTGVQFGHYNGDYNVIYY